MPTSFAQTSRPTPWQRLRAAAVMALGTLASAGAMAGFITLNEQGMDSIFSQSSFGAQAVDIRFNAPMTLVKPSLLGLDSIWEMDELRSLAAPGSKTLSMFFADSISWCGEDGSNFVGCADLGGPGYPSARIMVLKSSTAASNLGPALAAHELAHVLGLDHVNTSGNLMYPFIGGTSLSFSQVSSLLSSPMIQFDGAQRFVSITPIALVAQVPEPASWAMLGLGVLALGWRRRARAA